MSNETDVTEISIIPFGGEPAVSMHCKDGSHIIGPMDQEQFAQYAENLEHFLAAGRKLLDETKEES